MNNKVVILIIVIIVAVGGFFLLTRNANKPAQRKLSNSEPKTIAPPQAIHEVTLTASGFSPATINVNKGDTVAWINKSGKNATVNSDPHPTHNLYPFLNLGQFPNSYTVQTVFKTPGTFTYHNHLNPSEKGTIVVK